MNTLQENSKAFENLMKLSHDLVEFNSSQTGNVRKVHHLISLYHALCKNAKVSAFDCIAANFNCLLRLTVSFIVFSLFITKSPLNLGVAIMPTTPAFFLTPFFLFAIMLFFGASFYCVFFFILRVALKGAAFREA